MSPEASQCLTELQALVTPEMGWYLVFPDHEDGGELEPFVWDSSEQGDFTAVKLVQANGWLHPISLETVLTHWRIPEQIGAVNGDITLVPSHDRAKILLNSAQQEARAAIYQQIWNLIEAQAQNLQAFQLSSETDYVLTFLLGQITDQTWMGLAPVVPIATAPTPSPIQPPAQEPQPDAALREADSPLLAEIQTLLDRLGVVQIYGYYGGGYDQTHPYYLVPTVGQSADQVLEQIMQQTGLLSLRPFESLQPTLPDAPSWTTRFERLTQFLQQLSQMQIYQFSFWNQEQVYLVGMAAPGCWGGLHLRSQFIYNP